LRQPQAGVLVSLALIGLIFVAAPLLLSTIHGVPLSIFLVFVAIALTALVWGTGPSILVTLLGIVVVDHIQWDPHLALTPETAAIILDDTFTLVIGLLIGFLAGQNVEAHNRAEQLRERIVAQREEARATTVALQETARQMDAFLGMATHELKTPLTAILLALQLNRRRLEGLRRRSRDLSGGVDEQLDATVAEQVKVESQAKKLDRLVNDLLDLSRLQAGKLQIHPERTDLTAIVQRAIREQRQATPNRTIQLHLSQLDRPVWVQADADRIQQVILNYLTNALKYSPSDQPVEVGLDIEGLRTRVWVRDHGPGLPEAEQKRLWQRYYRAPGIEVLSGTGVGLGLGLTIVQQIVELHGGEVGIQSAPGRGSTFWFTLPLWTSISGREG
jgi:signal transduction histidine kinase